MTVYACDWTHWQNEVLPARQIADEGFGMVKLKAGGAKSAWHFEDPYFMRSADALLNEPRLIPGVFWYLMPGRPTAQAGLLHDLISETLDGYASWAVFLDIEQPGLTSIDVTDFCHAWTALTSYRLNCYSNYRYWQSMSGTHNTWGRQLMPFLEDAHWVSESVRKDAKTPYASQQAKAIDPLWWRNRYGGWEAPDMLQFTDYALVAGKRTTASLYRGTQNQLASALGLM